VDLYQKYSFRLLLFFFSLSTADAQVIDSLKNALKNSKEDIGRINILSAVTRELHAVNKHEESLIYINEGIALAEKLHNSKELSNLLKLKGDYFKFKFSYSKSLQEYTKALNIDTDADRKPAMAVSLDRLARLYTEMGDYNKAVSSFEKELELSKEISDTVQVSKILLGLWEVCYKNLKDLHKAAAALEEVQSIANTTTSSDSLRSYLLNRLGNFYFTEGDYEKAAEYLNKSLNFHKKKNDLLKMAVDYYDIGGLYEKVGNYHKALECYKEVFRIRMVLGDENELGKAYNNVGWGYQLIGDYQKAMDYQMSSYKYYLKSGNYIGTKFPIGNLGIIYNKLGNYQKAIEYSLRAMDLFVQSKDTVGIAEANNNIGLAYVNMGEYHKAITYLNKGLVLSQKLHNDYEVINSYSGLADSYENIQDHKKAFYYYKLFARLKDSVADQENSDRVSKINFSIENEKNQRAIELLSKDVLLNEAELKRQRTLTYSAITGVLLACLLMFFVVRGYREKKKSNELLETSHKEIEKSYQSVKLLSDIGREIASCLSIEDIIQNVYKNINSLMDASSFWIGIYNEENQSIDFPMGIEKGKRVGFASYRLSEDDRLPIWGFKNQKEVFVNDYLNDYYTYLPNGKVPPTIIGDRPESAIWYPLISKDNKTIGVFSVQSFQKNAYTPYDLSVVRSLAVFTSIALENTLLYREVEQKVIERTVEVVRQKEEIEQSHLTTRLLSDIGREITASLLVEDIVEKVYKRINTLMDAPIFLIGIHDKENNRLVIPRTIERGIPQPLAYCSLSDKTRPAVWCFDHQKELVMNDTYADFEIYFPGMKKPPVPIAGENSESLVYFPLTTANKKIGVLSFQSFKKNSFTEHNVDIIRTLVIYIATALENARLYEDMELEVKMRTAEIEKQKDELAKLSIVASETDSAIIIADAQANIEWVNASYTRLTGYSLEDLKAAGKTSILAVSGNPRIKEILDDCIELSKSAVYVVRNETKDGRENWVQTTLTPITGQDGKLKNLIAIDSDITELKNVEKELKQQHAIIFEKNKHITDSINYAKRIQDAILPPAGTVKSLFRDAFVFYKPKDIVSGDFYWMIEKQGKLFFAVVDCTGHGVPGAFVSIIGYNGLNRALNEFGLTKPSEILDKLNQLVEETFRQNYQAQISDGMDIALCSYDRKTGQLEFSGANNPLYVVSNGVLTEIKGDKQPIGAFEHRKKFKNNLVTLKKDDSIYIFSDGYADQFGGPSKKKFKYNQFKSMLVSLNGKSMQEQGEVLNSRMISWMGNLEQVDDICVIGMKI